MVFSRFMPSRDNADHANILRSHTEEERLIALVMGVSKEKSKRMARRGRDAIVKAYQEGKI
ncbi:hypothetical protein B2G63_31315 [Pseudomonas aeruginosa]|nr:hypothetical protein B2G63_31315 [Pseudomonas aeruginosa]